VVNIIEGIQLYEHLFLIPEKTRQRKLK